MHEKTFDKKELLYNLNKRLILIGNIKQLSTGDRLCKDYTVIFLY